MPSQVLDYRFETDPADQTIGRRLRDGRMWEQQLHRYYKTFALPGTTAVDAGANIGASAVPLARCVGRDGAVVALEPIAGYVALLATNARLNGVDDVVRVIPRAAAADAAAKFSPAGVSRKGNHGSMQLKSYDESDGAPLLATTIDAECAAVGKPVSLIKCDVEGHEVLAMSGAMRTITEHRPALVIEIWPHSWPEWRASAVGRLVQSLGYVVRRSTDNKNDWVFALPEQWTRFDWLGFDSLREQIPPLPKPGGRHAGAGGGDAVGGAPPDRRSVSRARQEGAGRPQPKRAARGVRVDRARDADAVRHRAPAGERVGLPRARVAPQVPRAGGVAVGRRRARVRFQN